MPIEQSAKKLRRSPWDGGWQICKAAVDAIFPSSCIVCKDQLDAEKFTSSARDQACIVQETDATPNYLQHTLDTVGLCDDCSEMLRLVVHQCVRCSAPVPWVAGKQSECPLCTNEKWGFHKVHSVRPYHGRMAAIVKMAKHASGESIAWNLGKILARHLKSQEISGDFHVPDCLVPVPTYWRKRFGRRFCPAFTIAEAIARDLNIPLRADLVVKHRTTEKQGLLSNAERKRNVAGAFKSTRACPKRILIVDDVFTSGATAHEIAKTLKKAGAKYIEVAVIARGIGCGKSI